MPWVKIAFIAFAGAGFFYVTFHIRPSGGRRRSILNWIGIGLSFWMFVSAVYLAFVQTGPRNSEYPFPDGTSVAIVMITSGSIVDSKLSSVMVRKNSRSKWQRVWSGDGWMAGGGEASPYLHWADSSHLVINLHQSNMPANCISNVEDIHIECRAHNW